MRPLLLLSVIIATFAIPATLTRRPGPARYADALKVFTVFVAVYVFLLLFVYPRLSSWTHTCITHSLLLSSTTLRTFG